MKKETVVLRVTHLRGSKARFREHIKLFHSVLGVKVEQLSISNFGVIQKRKTKVLSNG